MKRISALELESFLEKTLNSAAFSDYCPNGLQIEGKQTLGKLAFGVSATKDSIEKTIQLGCDYLIVHHGIFWHHHGAKTLKGAFAQRVFPFIQHQVGLFAYHLPLDAHLQLGNAASLAKLIQLENLAPFGDFKGMPTGVQGKFPTPLLPLQLQERLGEILKHQIILSSFDQKRPINSLGIITGGAGSDWILAKQAGCDAFLTGEISEHHWHESQESQVHLFAGGHNATEQFGILSLMEEISSTFAVECHFIPSSNPV